MKEYNWWYYYCFKRALADKLKANTDPLVAVDGTPSTNVYTLTIYGKQLPTPLTKDNVMIGQPNNIDAEVLDVSESTIDHVTIRMKFNRTATGCLPITITKGETTITASNLLKAYKLIKNVNDTTVEKDVLGGGRFVGIDDVLPITETAGNVEEGKHSPKEFPCILQQCLNLRPVNVETPTKLTTCTTGTDYCANMFTFIDRGKTAGTGTLTTSAKTTSAEGIATETVTCIMNEHVTTVDLLTDVNNKDGMTDADQEIEENPGAFVCENDDDDNGNGEPDKKDVLIDKEDDLKKVKITLEAIDTEGTIKLKRNTTNIRVWSNKEKDLFSNILTDNNEKTLNLSEFTIENGTYTKDVWVEGYTPGESMLTLEYAVGGQILTDDKIKFTVVKISIADIIGVCKDSTAPISVTVSPSPIGTNILLSLDKVDSKTKATFDDGTTNKSISSSTIVTVKGIDISDKVDDVKLIASLGGKECAVEYFSVIKLIIINPHGDPTQPAGYSGANNTNERSYNNAEPAILTVPCEAAILPVGLENKIGWFIEDIGEIKGVWNPHFEGNEYIGIGTTPTATFTGMPLHNSAFGPKKVTTAIANVPNCKEERIVEMFFEPLPTNNPGPAPLLPPEGIKEEDLIE
ncbi:MAG: hypothetical protein A2W23_09955 [Planctomycetes bacterium RBG_16_43_13]|nr:MAG: hypothetical protein A2W23_09955 [Planctomycetes bacterium RBG_16_43_13]